MDEAKLFDVLAKIVETNQAVLKQNQEFLGFLQVRDGRIAERPALEIKNLEHLNAANETQKAKYALEGKVFAELGSSQEEYSRVTTIVAAAKYVDYADIANGRAPAARASCEEKGATWSCRRVSVVDSEGNPAPTESCACVEGGAP
jgi:hypothetical protein